jgi:hypothetical protein
MEKPNRLIMGGQQVAWAHIDDVRKPAQRCDKVVLIIDGCLLRNGNLPAIHFENS